MSIPSARGMISLIHGTHCVHQDTFLKVHLLEVSHPQRSSRIQRIWHRLLADWSQNDTGKIEENEKDWERIAGLYNANSSLCHEVFDLVQEEILKIVWWKIRGIRSLTRISITSQTHQSFQCWKTNLKTEVCSNSRYRAIAMLWIKEVEVSKSVDGLVTSQSVEGRDFSRFWNAWCEDSVCIEEDHL